MGHAIATQEGLSIEYDEDVCCDVCQSVSCLNKLCTVSYCIYRNKEQLFFGSFLSRVLLGAVEYARLLALS